MLYTTGSLVKTRGREWVALPESTDGRLTIHTPERSPKIALTRLYPFGGQKRGNRVN